MAYEILLATGNAKKLIEMRRILADHPIARDVDITVHGLADVPVYPQPAETERTFEGNALIKARAGVAATGLPSLADDSGLAVDVLNGMPGVRSARWSGPDATDDGNIDLLLRQLHDVPAEARTAQFVSAVALALPDGREFTRRGEMPGRLLTELRGDNGFGYDPMFVADATLARGDERSNGELTAEQKDAISHRGIAIRAIVEVLVGVLEESALRGE